ncbi:MAG: RyR domain-containing protein [Planctomycetaceae bacterium]
MTIEQMARVCHEANRGYQAACPQPGIPVAPPWDEFPVDQQAVVIDGVRLALRGATPRDMHESWLMAKVESGWKYGDVKDAVAKTHPCMVSYDLLPQEQRRKDALFLAVVGALSEVLE